MLRWIAMMENLIILNKDMIALLERAVKPGHSFATQPTIPKSPILSKKRKMKERRYYPMKNTLSFPSVHIEGDSHARHLAGLVQQLVTTPVTGVCKPGARLVDVTSGSPPPPESCAVMFAGANDVASGEQDGVYRHLEQRIAFCLSSARAVVVSTIPHRYDLHADHPVNQQTGVVNHFIEELCARNKHAVLLDFNSIGRRMFTRHGMHLRMGGKRLLAKLLLRSLRMADSAAHHESPPPEPRSPSSSISSGPLPVKEEPRV